MATAAAAAAAVATQLRIQAAFHRAETTASKQLLILLEEVGSLDDQDFHKFVETLGRSAYRWRWHKSILDHSIAPPSPPDPTDEIGLGDYFKYEQDVSNFYHLLYKKSRGARCEPVVTDVRLGDAKAMWTAIKDYYERKDEAGKLLATEKFSQATMASTQLPIGAFCAELERLAKVLIMAGGEASEATIRTKLLASLLKEFDVVVTYIHE